MCKAGETPRFLSSRSITKNFTGKCFFCNQTAKNDVLHQCQGLLMDVRVGKIALKLGDTKLLAKLREGDIVAVEAVYHSNCLSKTVQSIQNSQ